MSEFTLKLAGDPGPATPASGRWITAREAAERSGLNLGSINRCCLQDWQHRSLARRDRLPNGQTGWLIDEAADPRFVLAKSAEQKDEAFNPIKLGLSTEQTQEVLRRRKIVSDWSDAVRASANIGLHEDTVTTQFLARLKEQGGDCSRTTLYRWLADWRKNGINGLIDARWKGQRTTDDYSDFMAVVTQLYLDARQRSLMVCYEIARDRAERNGWSFPSYRTTHRLISRLDPAVVSKKRMGEKHFIANVEPSISRDYSSLASNDWWCSDDTQMDVWVRHGDKPDGTPNHIRPFLHAWQDLRSRKIVAWRMTAESPTTHTVLRTVVKGIIAHGVPRVVYVDNGKHFDSRLLQGRTKAQRHAGIDIGRCDGAFGVLGIQTVHAWPYHGQSKPIERFFGTLEGRFGKLWDTYAGKDTLSKPEDLKRKLATGQAPTLEEFTAAFAEWLAADYNARAHTGDAMDGKTPDAVHAEQLQAKRTLPVELLEFATFERTKPVKVQQNGVTWQGWQFGQFQPELIRRLGEKVILAVDDRDLSRVYVCDLEGRLICKAPANTKAGFSAGKVDNAALREGIAEKKRLRRAVAAYHEARPKLAMDVPELAIAAARRRNGVTPPAQPSRQLRTGTADVPIQPVRTAFDDQLAGIQRLSEGPSMRIAPAQADAPALPAGFSYRRSHEEGDDE